MEINPDNLKYKRYDNLNGPIYTVSKSEIIKIVFPNGVTEQINPNEGLTKEDDKNNEEDFFSGDAADTLFFTSGKKTVVKILMNSTTEIKYKLWDFQDGPTYQVGKNELNSIHTGKGKIISMAQETKKEEIKSQPDEYAKYTAFTGYSYAFNQRLYDKGKIDARRYYRHNGGAVGVGCAAAGCGPLIGIIPAVIVADNEPKEINLRIPPSEYSTHHDYLTGYKEEAKRIKKKKVWTGYGIGSGVLAALTIVYYIILLNGI